MLYLTTRGAREPRLQVRPLRERRWNLHQRAVVESALVVRVGELSRGGISGFVLASIGSFNGVIDGRLFVRV